MPISERMLRKWRGEALGHQRKNPTYEALYSDRAGIAAVVRESNRRILMLTQELLDQALLRREEAPK